MRKRLGILARWTLLILLSLAVPSALADPINTISGVASKDLSSPPVWQHVSAIPSNANAGGGLPTSASRYALLTASTTYGCVGATCATIEPVLMLDPAFDGILTSNNGLFTTTTIHGFNGTGWDRIRTEVGDDANTPVGVLNNIALLVNGGAPLQSSRQRSATVDAMSGIGIAAAGPMLFNGTTWDRMRSTSDFTAGTGVPGAQGLALNIGSNPGTVAAYNQLAGAGALSLTGTANGSRFSLTVPASTWSVTNTPAVATQATASRAAGAAGVRHVATTVTVCLATGATAQTPILAHLRDGATGAGTILRSWAHSAPANSTFCNNVDGLAMIGTAATAMTVEFTGAGVAASQQTVTLTGFSTQ